MNKLLQYIEENRQDAVLFKADYLLASAGEDAYKKDAAIEEIKKMLATIESEVILESYTTKIAKKAGVKPTVISKLVKTETVKREKAEQAQYVAEGKRALPKWIDKNHFYAYGFDQKFDAENKADIGIYFAASNNEARQLTNCTIKPLVFIKSDEDNKRRLTEVYNGYIKAVIELPSRSWNSTDMFESTLMDRGVYFTFDGFTKSHLNKLKAILLPQYKECYELKTLGWQPEGFFAYANLLYKENPIEFDNYGIAEIENVNYLSMSASKELANHRSEDDLYKNDKYLSYQKGVNIDFADWSGFMVAAYLDKGMMGVCWAIMAAYRDVIYRRNNNCPLPYSYGAAQSGKSKFCESIANIFTYEMPAFNLNQGTEYAYWERMERFRNVPVLFNEFDEKSIREEFTRGFKGAFDGEGRTKGAGRKNKTKTQDVNCLPVLLGQYLSTSDDGAILQRTLPEKFTEDNKRPAEQAKAFSDLKKMEKKGITHLSAELMKHRRYIVANFEQRYEEMAERLKKSLAADNISVKTRIAENYTNAIAITSLVADKIPLAFSIDKFFEYCKVQLIGMSNIISESNALAKFWKMVEYMVDQGMIEQGYNYKVETHSSIRLGAEGRDVVNKTFDEPKKLLFIRLNSIHSIYMGETKKQTGKNGIDEATVKIYMKDQESYIGNNPSSSFKSSKGITTHTSSFIFDYDALAVNLERTTAADEELPIKEIKGKLAGDCQAVDKNGVMYLRFTVTSDESYIDHGITVEKFLSTTVFTADKSLFNKLLAKVAVKCTGPLKERSTANGTYREMYSENVELIDSENLNDYFKIKENLKKAF
jgi:hypothetical protein